MICGVLARFRTRQNLAGDAFPRLTALGLCQVAERSGLGTVESLSLSDVVLGFNQSVISCH